MLSVKNEIDKLALNSSPEAVQKFASSVSAIPYISKIIDDLRALLADKNWKIRKCAADVLICIGPSILSHFEEIYLEENEDKIYWSLHILGNIKTEQSYEILKTALNEGNKSAKMHAIQNIVKMQFPDMIDVLINILNDPKWSVRKVAADALCEAGPHIISTLLTAFAAGTDDQKYWLIRCIGKIMGPRGARPLIEFYEKGSEKDRYYAVLALGEIRDDIVVPTLIKALSDSSWLIRKQAAETLIMYGDTAVPMLTSVIGATTDSDIHYWSLQIIAKILGKRAINFLRELLMKSESNINLRTYITIALGQIDCDESIELLIQSFSDNCWLIRKQAHEILVQKGHKALAPLILKLDQSFESEDENICHWTVKTILKMENFVIEPLKRLADSENPKIRLLIVQLLQEFKNIKTAEILLNSLKDTSWPVRSTAAKALIEMGELINPHVHVYFKKNKDSITADQCFWIKKIFSSIKKPELYASLCEALDVKDLKELLPEDVEMLTALEEEINMSIPAEEPALPPPPDDDPELHDAKISGSTLKIVSSILKDAYSEFSDIRLIAIKNIFQITDILTTEIQQQLYKAMMDLCSDPDEFVRTEASKSLKFLDSKYNVIEKFQSSPEEIKKLTDSLKSDDETEVITSILKLQASAGENAEKNIAQLLKSSKSAAVHKVVLESLGNMKSEKYDFVIIPFLSSENPELVESAIIALGKIKNQKSLAAVIGIYGEYQETVLNALKNVSEKDICAACGFLLNEDNIAYKVNALKLLNEFRFEGATDIFTSILVSNNLILGKLAIMGLRLYNDNNSIHTLKKILPDITETELKNKIQDLIVFLAAKKDEPSRLAAFSETARKSTLLKPSRTSVIEEDDGPSALDSIMTKARLITGGLRSKETKEDTKALENDIMEMKFVVGKHIFDLLKKRKLQDITLSKLVYDIERLNESISKRREMIGKLDNSTAKGSSESFLGIPVGKIKDSLNKKNTISSAEAEIEKIEIRKNQIFIKLAETGMELYRSSDVQMEELDAALNVLEKYQKRLEEAQD